MSSRAAPGKRSPTRFLPHVGFAPEHVKAPVTPRTGPFRMCGCRRLRRSLESATRTPQMRGEGRRQIQQLSVLITAPASRSSPSRDVESHPPRAGRRPSSSRPSGPPAAARSRGTRRARAARPEVRLAEHAALEDDVRRAAPSAGSGSRSCRPEHHPFELRPRATGTASRASTISTSRSAAPPRSVPTPRMPHRARESMKRAWPRSASSRTQSVGAQSMKRDPGSCWCARSAPELQPVEVPVRLRSSRVRRRAAAAAPRAASRPARVLAPPRARRRLPRPRCRPPVLAHPRDVPRPGPPARRRTRVARTLAGFLERDSRAPGLRAARRGTGPAAGGRSRTRASAGRRRIASQAVLSAVHARIRRADPHRRSPRASPRPPPGGRGPRCSAWRRPSAAVAPVAGDAGDHGKDRPHAQDRTGQRRNGSTRAWQIATKAAPPAQAAAAPPV